MPTLRKCWALRSWELKAAKSWRLGGTTGWDFLALEASGGRLFVTPLYHVNQLYNAHRGRDRLKVTVEGPTFDSSKEGSAVPVLDAVASRSAAGSRR